MKSANAIVAALCVALSSCAFTQDRQDAEEMYTHASALTKLSTVVESTVRYKNPSPTLTENELLAVSTAHDPQLLAPFANYRIRVLSQNRHAVVLMCSLSGDTALLEDAGCNEHLDRHHWQESKRPCQFTLKIEKVCEKD